MFYVDLALHCYRSFWKQAFWIYMRKESRLGVIHGQYIYGKSTITLLLINSARKFLLKYEKKRLRKLWKLNKKLLSHWLQATQFVLSDLFATIPYRITTDPPVDPPPTHHEPTHRPTHWSTDTPINSRYCSSTAFAYSLCMTHQRRKPHLLSFDESVLGISRFFLLQIEE